MGAARGGDVQAQSPRAQDHGRRARPHRNASVTSLKRDFGSHSFMGTMSASQSYQVGKLRHRGLPCLPTAAGAGCGAQRGAGPRAWDSVLLLPVPRPPPSSSPVTPGLLRRARLRPLAHLDTAPPTVTQSLHHIYAQDGGQGSRARRLGSWLGAAWPPSGAGRPPLHSARGRQLVAPSSRQAGRQWGRHSSSRRPGSSGQWPLRTGRARSPSQILGTATAGRVSHCAGTPRPLGTRPACLSARPPQRSLGPSRKSTWTWL